MPGVSPSKANKLTRRWIARLDDHVIGLAWSPDGKRLAAASVAGPVKIYASQSGEVCNELKGHGFGTSCLSWSGDGANLATGGQDGKVKLWDLTQNNERIILDGGAAWVERVAWCPVVGVLASAAGKKVRLWDAQGKMLREFADHPATIADIAWQPRAEILATASYGQLTLYRLNADKPYRRFEWKGSMLALAWSPNGQYVATGDQDATVHFWNVKKGDDLMMSGYPSKVKELSWDSSSRWLATGGGPQPCIWDCSGKGPADTTPVQLEAHTDRISALAFQHGPPILASACLDAQVALWHIGKTKDPLCVEFLPAPISQLRWSPDDRSLAVGTEQGDIAVYQLG